MTGKIDGNAAVAVSRDDLDELKICMYQAISSGLDDLPLPPEKTSVALAVAVYAHLTATRRASSALSKR
jgi:hypothetical protein